MHMWAFSCTAAEKTTKLHTWGLAVHKPEQLGMKSCTCGLLGAQLIKVARNLRTCGLVGAKFTNKVQSYTSVGQCCTARKRA